MNINSVIIHVTGLFEQTSCFRSGLIVPHEGKHVWDAYHVKLPHLYVSMPIECFKDHHFYIESFSEQAAYQNRNGIGYLLIFILSNHYSP